MSSYSLVVFDWDGTLMDSTHSIVTAIQGACQDLNLPVPSSKTASWVIGLSLESALHKAVPELTEAQLPEFLNRYRIHYLLRDPDLKLFDGTGELLASLAGQPGWAPQHRSIAVTQKYIDVNDDMMRNAVELA